MKTSNKLLKLVTFLCISFLVFGILACTNIVDHKEENSYIRISATTPNMRTILPTAFTENTKGLNWFLTGIKDDTTVTFNKSWTDTTDKTAYENMTSETFIIPEKGNWTLSLIAQIDGKNVLSCQLNQEIRVGENTLRFDMFEATGDNIANGQIDFTLKFPKDIVSKAEAYLNNKNDVDNLIHTEVLTVNTSDMSLNYKNESISSGYYILKIDLYQNVNNTDSLINTYTCLVRVAPGLCSKGEYQLEKLAQIFTINYNTNGGTFSDQFIPTTYNTYTKFKLPTPTKVGYIFTGWYTDADCSIEVNLDDSNAYNLTANVDLYAGWKAKGSQDNPITNWEDLVAVMTEDGGDIYISGNMTANKTLTVSKETKIIAKEAVSITRADDFTDTMFTVNATFTMEGSENARITIDGTSTNATYTIYSNGGGISLDYVTIQNCSISNHGGAMHVENATATMSNGSITNCNAGDAGAVYLTSANFTMTNVNITGCSVTLSGGAIWMTNSSSFIMDGGEISNCKTTGNEGGALYITGTGCSALMKGSAKITDCHSINKAAGGINLGGGTFTMTDDSYISACTANTYGNGIYINGGTFNISGNAYVDSTNDVYFSDNTSNIINISGNLTKDEVAKISLSAYIEGKQILSAADGVDLALQVGKFTLADEDFVIGSDGKIQQVPTYATGITYAVDAETGMETLYISSAEGLATFRDIVNGSLSSNITVQGKDNGNGKTFNVNTSVSDVNAVLEKDITISGEWTPIGVYSNTTGSANSYLGTFDGNKNTLHLALMYKLQVSL